MASPLKVLLLCGSRSTEHQISLLSCNSVFHAIDRTKFSPIVVGITLDGVWKYYGDAPFLENPDSPETVRLIDDAPACYPGRTDTGTVLVLPGNSAPIPFDVAFPVLHGAYGEDGTIQGLFGMFGVPCVGCDFTSSANCMDKVITKTLLEGVGFRTAPWLTLRKGEPVDLIDIIATRGLPLFVKPAKTGSSVGIRKVTRAAELQPAIDFAFQYDTKVLVETGITGREIECAVLEKPDGEIFVAHPGEVVPHDTFYSYEAKYLNPNGATTYPAARLTPEQADQVRALAAKAFRVLGCSGFSRIDFFLTTSGEWVLNEINTIPGFTSISLYPQMMKNSGIPYADLITILIQTALKKG